ncbi:Uncharacterised protein [Mycobacteroides abscessus subsp. abscessus]|nr:Uncharacterised protein [Mycobacteroides abscessus subsp. abscessus]
MQGVLEALGLHLAALADALRLTSGAALLGEERLRIGLRAQRAILPLVFDCVEQALEVVGHQGKMTALQVLVSAK